MWNRPTGMLIIHKIAVAQEMAIWPVKPMLTPVDLSIQSCSFNFPVVQ